MNYLAFDLDGTIFDVSDIAVQGFSRGIEEFVSRFKHKDIMKPDYDSIKKVLGIPIDDIFRQLFPDLNIQEQKMLNDFCTGALVELIENGGGEIFPGVHETLELFFAKGFTLYIASNGRPEYIISILRKFKLLKFFSEPLIFLNEHIITKTDIVAEYKRTTSEQDLLVMIGDRKNDFDAARDNNIPFIGCSFGHAESAEIAGANYIAHNFNEIPSLLQELTGKAHI